MKNNPPHSDWEIGRKQHTEVHLKVTGTSRALGSSRAVCWLRAGLRRRKVSDSRPSPPAAPPSPGAASHTPRGQVRANLKPTEHRAGTLPSHALGRHIGRRVLPSDKWKRPEALAVAAKKSLCSQGPTWVPRMEGPGAGGGC